MFAKAEWFQEKKIGVGVTPSTWQGWAYTTAAAFVVGAPFLMLVAGGQAPEALIWMAASVGALIWDMRKAMTPQRAGAKDEVFVINDETDISSLATRNYDMRLRN